MPNVDKLFYLDNFIDKKVTNNKKTFRVVTNTSNKDRFYSLCKNVNNYIEKLWNIDNQNNIDKAKNTNKSDKLLETQRKAIIGYENEINFFKDKISEYLKAHSLSKEPFPNWYSDLVSAIFHELFGLAGVAEWTSSKYKNSSSAKIIGSRIYFLINGKQVLQEQTINKERLNQLKRALLLGSPEVRLGNNHYAEVYMLNGTRITIYDEPLAKETTIVFRKYIVDNLTFDEQVSRGTIPDYIIPMFKAMIRIGYNVVFLGAVRSAKTTFLGTWQSYEDQSLEGIMVETDPEIPLHLIMPKAPITQLVADGDALNNITKKLMRGDADYLILAEARDPVALKIAIEVTSKGTRRVKSSYHITNPIDFPYDAANLIYSEFGGDLYSIEVKVAKGYHYYIELTSLKNKSQKRLKAIYESRYDSSTGEISLHQICKYEPLTNSWSFKYDIGKDKEDIAAFEDPEAFKVFKSELKKLEELYPMKENNVFVPIFGKARD